MQKRWETKPRGLGRQLCRRVLTYLHWSLILQSPRGRGLVAAYNPNSAEEEADRSLGPLATQFHLLEEFQATGKPCLPTASLLRKVANA